MTLFRLLLIWGLISGGKIITQKISDLADVVATVAVQMETAQMVEMMPAGTLENVKPGQTVIVSSTKGATSDRVTGIMLLANAEMLVRMATAQSGAGAAAGNRPSGAGGLPQGMPTGGVPSGMDLGGMLGGIGLSGMGP